MTWRITALPRSLVCVPTGRRLGNNSPFHPTMLRTYLFLVALVGIALLASQGSCVLLGKVPLPDDPRILDDPRISKHYTTLEDGTRTFNGDLMQPAMDKIIDRAERGEPAYDLWREEYSSLYEEDTARAILLYIMLATAELANSYRFSFPILITSCNSYDNISNTEEILLRFPGFWGDYHYNVAVIEEPKGTLGLYLDALETHMANIDQEILHAFVPLRAYIDFWRTEDQNTLLSDYNLIVLYNYIVEVAQELTPGTIVGHTDIIGPLSDTEFLIWICCYPDNPKIDKFIELSFPAGRSETYYNNKIRRYQNRHPPEEKVTYGFRQKGYISAKELDELSAVTL